MRDISEPVITATEQGDTTTLHYVQDIEPILKNCAEARRQDREVRGEFGKRAEWRHTAQYSPLTVMEVARKLGIPGERIFHREEQERISKDLRSSEFAAFRMTIDKNSWRK